MHPLLSLYLLQPSPAISPDDITLLTVNRYSLHWFPVQSPHTKDAILYSDVTKRHCGYHPFYGKVPKPFFRQHKEKRKTVVWLRETTYNPMMVANLIII